MASSLVKVKRCWTIWHFIWAIALLGGTVGIMFDAWVDTFRLAVKDEEVSYVLVAPLVLVWLIWIRRGRLRYCVPGGSTIGLVMIAGGWFLWSYGYKHRVITLWHAGPVLAAAGVTVTVFGRQLLLRFLPVFCALIFLVPISAYRRHYLAMPLQTATAHATQKVCELLGVAVDRSGNLLTINGVDVAVAEACNGMRMVITLFLVSYILAFTTPLRGYGRAVIILASPVTAIVFNVVRLVPTVWVFGNASKQTADIFHLLSGWVMLGAAFLVMRGTIDLLRWARVPIVPFALAGN